MTDPIVLHESSGVIAIAKPAGLATQAPPGIPSAESWLRQRLHGDRRDGYLGVPHRLDRAVSGVLLMAATPRAARQLSRQFERRTISKTYLAVVAGATACAEAFVRRTSDAPDHWRDLVEKVPDEPRARVADAGAPAAREAITLARALTILATPPAGVHVLASLEPLTGRMHQLRLQAALRGLPIVGDDLYGGPPAEPDPSEPACDPRTRPIALHAWRIRYTDPDAPTVVTIEAPLPRHFSAMNAVAPAPAESGPG